MTVLLACAALLPLRLASAQEPTGTQPAQTPTTQPAQAPATQPAQQPETAPTTQPGPEGGVSEIDPASLQTQIAQLEAAGDVPEKAALLEVYKQALDLLKAEGNWVDRESQFRARREKTPQDLEAVRASIAQATSQPTTQPVLDIPPDATLEQLTQLLAEREAELAAAKDAQNKHAEEAKLRETRRTEIPGLISERNTAIENIRTELRKGPASTVSPQMAQARRKLLLAQRRAYEAEIKALEEELRTYAARAEVLAGRRDEARLKVAAKQGVVDALTKLVSDRRAAEIERQKRQAEEELRRASPAVKELAERNARLAEERAKLAEGIDKYTQKVSLAEQIGGQLQKDIQFVRENVDQAVRPEDLAARMQSLRARLLDHARLEGDLVAARNEMARVSGRLAEVEEELDDLRAGPDFEARVAELLSTLGANEPPAVKERLEARIKELLTARREALDKLKVDLTAHKARLNKYITDLTLLLGRIAEYRSFVDEHVFWLRSTGPLYEAHIPKSWRKTGEIALGVLNGLATDVVEQPVPYGLCLLIVLLLFLIRPRSRARLIEISGTASRAFTDSFRLTTRALFHSVVLTAPWPALLWLAAWRVAQPIYGENVDVYSMAQAIADGLSAAALVLLTLTAVRVAALPKGLCEVHFRWSPASLKLVRRHVSWLTLVIVPAALVVTTTESYPDGGWRDLVGRIAMIVGAIALGIFGIRVFNPKTGIPAEHLRHTPSGWAYNLRYIWFGAIAGAPLALASLSAAGYHYTAVELAKRLVLTTWLVLGVLFVNALIVRWLFVEQRRLAVQQARAKRAAALAKAEEEEGDPEVPEIDEEKINLVTVGDQTRRLVRALSGFALLVGVTVAWADMLPAFAFLDNITIWPIGDGGEVAEAVVGERDAPAATEEGEGETRIAVAQPGERRDRNRVSLADLVVAILIATATLVLARNIPGLLEISILQRLPMDAGARFATTSLARYSITIIGLMVAFAAIGVTWSSVQWLAAAITVGLGFGLQEIFANFVSGIIILFERPVRVGDTVTVGQTSGTVTRIRIRATTITDWDRKELLIPNKEFVTGQIVNWTLTDTTMRIVIPVGVAYGSDTRLAREILLRIATENERVLDDPKPRALFLGFGDSTLNLDLRVYIASLDDLLATKDELHTAIDEEFKKAGIEIAFPQRDIHIRSIEAPLPLRDDRRDGHPRAAAAPAERRASE